MIFLAILLQFLRKVKLPKYEGREGQGIKFFLWDVLWDVDSYGA